MLIYLSTLLYFIIIEYTYYIYSGGLVMSNDNSCGCGRSPTGKCIGWHSLSEKDYQEKLAAYEEKKNLKK